MDKPKFLDFWISGILFRNPPPKKLFGFLVYGFRFRNPLRCLGFWVSGFLDFVLNIHHQTKLIEMLVFGFRFRNPFRCLGLWVSEFLGFWVYGFLDF